MSFGVHVPYGEVKLKIPKGDFKTDAEVTTPNATHSIRGTELVIRNYPDVHSSDRDVFYVHVQVSEGRCHSETEHNATDVPAGDQFDHTLIAAEEREDRYRRILITPFYGGSAERCGCLTGSPGDLSPSGYPTWSAPAGTNPDYNARILSHERAGLPLPGGPPAASP